MVLRSPNLWIALAVGLAAAALVAVFVAYFATRLRDIYFAITTLVFSQIFYVIIFTWTEVTGGENGLYFTQPPFTIPGIWSARFSTLSLHWFVLAIVTLSVSGVAAHHPVAVRDGAAVDRENEPRTRAIGYHVERYKIVAVLLCGAVRRALGNPLCDPAPLRRAGLRVPSRSRARW